MNHGIYISRGKNIIRHSFKISKDLLTPICHEAVAIQSTNKSNVQAMLSLDLIQHAVLIISSRGTEKYTADITHAIWLYVINISLTPCSRVKIGVTRFSNRLLYRLKTLLLS